MRAFDFEPTTMGKGRHTVWQRDGFRQLTINYHGKHLDDRSFKSSLRTLGIKKNDFFVFLKTETIPEPLAAKLREHKPVFLAN